MAEALLQNTRVPLEQVDVFAVSMRPGSFTGIRIGVAAVKGMAMASSKPCAAVSTLEAIGENYRGQEALVCAVMDARCNQVYNALFDCESGEVTRLCQDRALSIEDLFTELAETPAYRERKLYLPSNGIDCALTGSGGTGLACARAVTISKSVERSFCGLKKGGKWTAVNSVGADAGVSKAAAGYQRAEQTERSESTMIALGADHGGYRLKEAVKAYLEERESHIRISEPTARNR